MQEDQPPLPQPSDTQGKVPSREVRPESPTGSTIHQAEPKQPPEGEQKQEEPKVEAQKQPGGGPPEKSGGPPEKAGGSSPATTASPEATPEKPSAPPGKASPPKGPKQAGASQQAEPRGPERRGPRSGPRGGERRAGGGREQRGGGRSQYQSWSKPEFLARAVEGGIDRLFIENAFEFARTIGSNLSANYFRSVHGEVLRQEMAGFDLERFLLLKPRLAYLAARAGRAEMRDLRIVLERGVEKVCADGIADEERQARFERFSRCLEAILAYHKVYERRQGERV